MVYIDSIYIMNYLNLRRYRSCWTTGSIVFLLRHY
jgi:hypothetical protein